MAEWSLFPKAENLCIGTSWRVVVVVSAEPLLGVTYAALPTVLIRVTALDTLSLGEALTTVGTGAVGAAWFHRSIYFWKTRTCILVTPEPWFALPVGITRRETCTVEGGADVAWAAFLVALAVRVLRWLSIAIDILVLAVEITVVKLTALRHIDWAVIGIEALRVAVADVLFTRVAILVSTVLWGDILAAIELGVAWAADLLLITGFPFRNTEESAEAVIARVCTLRAFFWDWAGLVTWVAERAT